MKLIILLFTSMFCVIAFAQEHDMSHMDGHAGMEPTVNEMSTRHLEMGGHMKMTAVRELRPGDEQRADHVVAAAREVMRKYADYRVALAEGFQIFMPNVPQKMYHFTNYRYALQAAFRFIPEHPTSLLYEKHGDSYKLVGVMYTAPKDAPESELDERIPLSIAQWHAHINFCAAPKGHDSEYFMPKPPKFGLAGSITTREECEAAGGRFLPQVFGWMVHVYPNERDAKAIWSVERQMDHHHGD